MITKWMHRDKNEKTSKITVLKFNLKNDLQKCFFPHSFTKEKNASWFKFMTAISYKVNSLKTSYNCVFNYYTV